MEAKLLNFMELLLCWVVCLLVKRNLETRHTVSLVLQTTSGLFPGTAPMRLSAGDAAGNLHHMTASRAVSDSQWQLPLAGCRKTSQA
jgi:hypothetical protein